MIRFVDRIAELETLERDWNSRKSEFVVVFGRRRIGKTTLLNEFTRNKEGIKYTAEDVNKAIQISQFKDILARSLPDEFLARQEIADWSSLFMYLSKTLDQKKRKYLWIDEFSYLIKNDPSITSSLQKFYDDFVKPSHLFVIASGSLFGLMSEKVLSSSSPLYGRRTRDILLKPIPFSFAREFLPFNFEDQLKTILVLNGIPEYLLVASKHKNFKDFISAEFLRPEGYFFREPLYLLSQDFKEIKTYFSILNAIAYGNSHPAEIANFIGVNSREIYPYLELLINYGFVSRESSMLGDRKRGVYYIQDNFFDFWFNVVHRNREAIENRESRLNQDQLKAYLGKRFEIFIRQHFSAICKGFDHSGRWWHKDKEIDVVAVNDKSKALLFGECKWQEKVKAAAIAKSLADKAKDVGGKGNKTILAIFAKSFSQKIDEWEGKPVYCFDFQDLEKIFAVA